MKSLFNKTARLINSGSLQQDLLKLEKQLNGSNRLQKSQITSIKNDIVHFTNDSADLSYMQVLTNGKEDQLVVVSLNEEVSLAFQLNPVS